MKRVDEARGFAERAVQAGAHAVVEHGGQQLQGGKVDVVVWQRGVAELEGDLIGGHVAPSGLGFGGKGERRCRRCAAGAADEGRGRGRQAAKGRAQIAEPVVRGHGPGEREHDVAGVVVLAVVPLQIGHDKATQGGEGAGDAPAHGLFAPDGGAAEVVQVGVAGLIGVAV